MKLLEFANEKDFFAKLKQFCQKGIVASNVTEVVSEVLHAVQKQGDTAVLKYTKQFDGANLKTQELRVSHSALKEAERSLSASDKKAIRESIRLVKAFHKNTLPKNWSMLNEQGGRVGERFYPIDRVGLYIPGGNVPLVSTVVMTATLAQLVGCPEVIVCTPPAKDGSIAPAMLATLSIIGIKEVYKVGGYKRLVRWLTEPKAYEASIKFTGRVMPMSWKRSAKYWELWGLIYCQDRVN